MVQPSQRLMTLREFLTWLPATGSYELHDGVVVEMQPRGSHEAVIGWLNRKLNAFIDRQDLPYFIPNTALVQPLGYDSAYRPDLVLLDPAGLTQEPLWQRESVVTLGTSIALIVEVVSSNWPDDYARKFEDYEAMGISEYWIVDYRGLGGRRYIGTPKQPTLTLCSLSAQTYTTTLLRRDDQLVSSRFPDLTLPVAPIFAAGS